LCPLKNTQFYDSPRQSKHYKIGWEHWRLCIAPHYAYVRNFMSTKDVYDELKIIMTDALLQMSRLAESAVTRNADFLGMTQIFLISIMSTAAEIAETVSEGSATWLYAEIETAAKHGGIDAIRKATTSKNQYSIADMAPDDFPSAMNLVPSPVHCVTLLPGL
jgi:hypothetical protein